MLNESDYAYSVAKIRYYENTLLDTSDTERLIACEADEYLQVLADLGYSGAEEAQTLAEVLNRRAVDCYQTIVEAAPEPQNTNFLVVENDFHNLKAVLKALVAQIKPQDLFVLPALIEPNQLNSLVLAKKYSQLPPYLSAAAEEAYALLTRTGDGQLCEIYLDRLALQTQYEMAEQTGCEFFIKLARFKVLAAAMKMMMRAAAQKKDETFVKAALPEVSFLNHSAIIRATRTVDDALAFLEKTMDSAAAEAAKTSLSSFEKYLDDAFLNLLGEAKIVGLGPQPLAAYYFATAAEIKTVRIIYACKKSGLTRDEILKRVRALYV